jgi:Ca2+-binding EF-hand superfamily protein
MSAEEPIDEDSHPREWILFTRIDLDGDRKLQKSEVEHYFQTQGLDNVSDMLMDKLDADGDGEIDFAEFVSGYAYATALAL